MKLACDSCGAPIPAADVELGRMLAKCRRCDSVFPVRAQLGLRAPPPRERPQLPAGVRIESGEPPLPREGDYRTAPLRERGPLVISRRWFGWHHIPLLSFCIVWNTIVAGWYSLAIGTNTSLALLFFPLLHGAIGIAMTYSTLAGLLNRTFIRVAEGALSIRHGPMPWIGNVTLPMDELRHLFVQRRTHRDKHVVHYTWDLVAETEERARVPLLRRLPELEQAHFIEWAIEKHLGIENELSVEEHA